MENASKALLIAAAVLVVIILISVGMKIYSSTTGTQKVATDTETTINDKTKTATDIAISEISGKSAQSNAGSNASGQKIGDVITKDNYGDYIDLGQSIEGIETSSSADDWRILYNDKTNNVVYAILADYLPNSNPAITASGLHKVDGTAYNVNSDNRDNLINSLNNETVWNSLIPNKLLSKGATVIGATNGNIIVSSYNEKYNINPPKGVISSTHFYIDDDSSKEIDSLYIPHQGDYYYECRGYWTVRRSTANNYGIWYIRDGSFSSGSPSSTDKGVRPVVSLPSSIQVTKNGEVWKVVQ